MTKKKKKKTHIKVVISVSFLFQIIEKKKKHATRFFFEVESKFIDNLINKIIMFGKIMIIKKKLSTFIGLIIKFYSMIIMIKPDKSFALVNFPTK